MSESRERIRVLIADDHAVVREGLKLFLGLQEDIEVVGEAADGGEAIARARELLPDVVLMDLVMPGTNGVEATLEIKASCPGASVLVLTSFMEDETVRSVLRAGATGYLMKDAQPPEIADAVRKVHRGDPLIHPEALRRLLREFEAPRVGESPSASAAEGRRPQTPESELEASTMTIAFSDIENSSQIIQELGDEDARVIFREHDNVVRPLLAQHGGTEVQHLGDGFMLAFSSARQAVRCAIAVQRALAEYAETHPGRPVRVRIGMHTGEVLSETHGYFGEAVWLAARINAKASGSQILVSDLTQRIVGSSCPCADRGEFELKGIPGMHRLYEVTWSEA